MDRWRRRCRSGFLALLLILLIALLSAAPAAAHTELVDTSPADGKRLSTSPGAVSLTFSGEVLKIGAAAEISGPGSADLGAAKLRARTVSWPLGDDLPNGTYTVRWRVTAADGHPIDGKFSFVLRAPAQPTPSTTGAPSAGAATGTPTPVVTPHTAEPEMTGPMPGMEGMPGMAARPPATPSSPQATAVAIAGLVLLTLLVVGAIVIERRRRPSSAAAPPGPASD